MTYLDAGVDIRAGDRAVDLVRDAVESTYTPPVMGTLGRFAACFRPDFKRLCDPVLVSSADGVGTKLLVASMAGRYDTIGIDCVAMCVNDVAAMGATPLFFLDYVATGRLDPGRVAELVSGVAAGCREAGCALIGGETAEMPGVFPADGFDLAGFCVGVVERDSLLDGSRVRAGDVLVGLRSSGVHSNGLSLARMALFERAGLSVDTFVPELGRTVGEELLVPARIYTSAARNAIAVADVHAAAHVTGGGLVRNVPRSLPGHLQAEIDYNAWEPPPIFDLIRRSGGIEADEMRRTFNMGIGFVMAVSAQDASRLVEAASGEGATLIGRVVRR